MKPRLVLAALMPRDVVARARDEFDAVVADGPDDMTAEEVIAAATRHRADAIMFVNTLPLSAEAIARLPASVRVGATSSVGYDHIDVAAAKARGLVVTNTPGVLTDCTADLAFMMLLAAARRAYEYDAIMRDGWRFRIGQGDLLGVRVSGKTLGILGMGRIGRAWRSARAASTCGCCTMRAPACRPNWKGRRVCRRLPRHAAALPLPVAARPGDAGDRPDHRCARPCRCCRAAPCW